MLRIWVFVLKAKENHGTIFRSNLALSDLHFEVWFWPSMWKMNWLWVTVGHKDLRSEVGRVRKNSGGEFLGLGDWI